MTEVTQDWIEGAGQRCFLAVPSPASGGNPSPTVVLLHERYGLVRHTQEMAIRLAQSGFAIVAPDLFFDAAGIAQHGESSARVRISDSTANERIAAAVDVLRKKASADTGRLAVIGVCQTGRYALSYAAASYAAAKPTRCCVALYGAAQPRDWEVTADQPDGLEAMIGASEAPFLGLFGELDHLISRDDVLRVREAFERHNRSYVIHQVAGAPHGWLNDTMPGRYRADAAELAWEVLVAFLRRHLEGDVARKRVIWEYHSDVSIDYDFRSNVRLE